MESRLSAPNRATDGSPLTGSRNGQIESRIKAQAVDGRL